MNVEFVSVNPTGPLHVGHARYASYGDALCRILSFVGHDVTREFYVNDYGTQMTRFGAVARRPLRAAARPRHAGARGGLPGRLPARPRRRAHRRGGRPLPRALEAAAPDVAALPADVVERAQGLGPRRDPRAVPADARAPARAVRRVDAGELALPGRRRAPRLRRRGGQVARRPRRREAPLRRGGRLLAARPRGTATTRTASSSARPATPPTSSATSPTTATRWTAGSRT